MSEDSILQVKNLTVHFTTDRGTFPAVDDVSWSVGKKEIVALVGESGSGKTVSCLSIIGLVPSAKVGGSVLFKGEELLGRSPKELGKLRGDDIGFVFQEPMTSLDPVFTVGSQMDETLKTHTKLNKAGRRKRTLELFELVGIPEPDKRYKCYPHELSGGMKQRVMIAMALCCEPDVLIADEPTTALDVTIQAQVLALLKDLQRKLSMSIVIVTHDLGVVANFADRVVVMYAGKIIEQGAAKQVLRDPQHAYTRGLLASVPKISTSREQPLHVIRGNIPDPSRLPEGCRFSLRCEGADDRCHTVPPPVTVLEPGRTVCCWQYAGAEREVL